MKTKIYSFLARGIHWVRSRPTLSTLFAAGGLSIIWASAWFFVLLFTSIFLKVPTSFSSFMIGFLASTAAEGVIKYFEVCRYIEYFSDPSKTATGENGYSLVKAITLFALGTLSSLTFLFIVKDTFSIDLNSPELQFFTEVENPSWDNINNSVSRFFGSTLVQITIGIGFIFRLFIYQKAVNN